MKIARLIIYTFLLSATVTYGQDKPKTILWKVTKPGSKQASFLFGTFHEVSPSFFNSLSNVVSRLLQSDALFVEARTTDLKELTVSKQPKWNQKQWRDLLTSEQEQLFAAFVAKADDSSYYQLNPLLLSLTTSRLYLINFCNSDTAFQELMDTHIEKLAINQHKPVYALDNDQNLLLRRTARTFRTEQDSIYASYSIRYMKSMLNNDGTDCEVINTYQSFDLDYELEADLVGNPANSVLLVERNKKWTKTLHRAFASQNCFVAVGFRHLFYKQGLIQQLRQLGYLVTPVDIVK